MSTNLICRNGAVHRTEHSEAVKKASELADMYSPEELVKMIDNYTAGKGVSYDGETLAAFNVLIDQYGLQDTCFVVNRDGRRMVRLAHPVAKCYNK